MEIEKVQLMENGGYKVNDSLFVPNAPGNRHYREVLEWIEQGNTPIPVPTPSLEKLVEEKITELYRNVKRFIEFQPNNFIRYDSDLKLNISTALTKSIQNGVEEPNLCALFDQ